MLANRSIAFKLILIITICSACIFMMIFGYNYYRSHIILEKELENNARNLTLASVNRVETVLNGVTKASEGLARSLEHGATTHELRIALLKAVLADNPQIYGCGAAFEPHATGPYSRPYAPYFRRDKENLVYVTESSFLYLRKDWYQISREMEAVEWTEPYYDENGTGILMATCSVPFFETTNGSRRLSGIVVSDISLEWLTQLVGSIKVLQSGYAFLLSRNGTIVTHPDREMIMNDTIFSIAESRNDPALRILGKRMIKGGSGFIPFTSFKGDQSWLYYAPIPSVGWTLAVVFPEAELLAQVKTLSITGAIMGLVGIFLLALVVTFIARSITTPLSHLAEATAEIAGGNFDVELPPVRSHDEVGKLNVAFRVMKSSLDEKVCLNNERLAARSHDEVDTLTIAFQVMRNSLKDHIKKLTETTVAKERIESELNIAHDIQMGLLPKIFPPFPDRQEFDLFALMQPAKEVGGDFYDFFFIDDTHLCLVIADVSGKGVPAALFMAMSMTLIKATARYGLSPDEILSRVNNELARGNDSCMFVTTFFGIFDTESGELAYANGGHNPPLHLKRDGTISWLPISGCPMVGTLEDVTYQREQLLLEPGDSLFLYTDGVTEAMNLREEPFSEEQLELGLSTLQGSGIRDIVYGIMANIRSFTGKAPQSDDITMMMIRYLGKSKVH
ncbi:MAG: phosphoserine phosphatase RsbU/P [Syntrophus sp. SKADARSKE-3]|nr:phosphoserine phosphatase RsbU/P [Syntrophus sp. SKADARSKE-3]